MKSPFTKKHNNAPNIEGLREFLLSSDRDYAPFFVGRTTVLDDINNSWQHRMKQWFQGNTKAFSSSTRIVQGAPGAGKTSVGARLAKELWNPEHSDYIFRKYLKKAPHVVNLNAKTLNDQMEVLTQICLVVNPKVVDKIKPTSSTRGYNLGGGASGVANLGYHKSTTRNDRDKPTVITWRPLQETLGKKRWTRPVCLLIDEAQTLDQPGIDLLASIHDGSHQLPIFPLLLGLGNTRARLQKGGISRLEGNAVHTLPALTQDEVEELCDRYFTTFLIKGTSDRKNEIGTGLHAWSQGWPAHMHNALLGLTRELIKAEGDLTTVSCKKSMAHAQTYRDSYYSDRMGTVFNTSSAFLGEFMTGVNSEKKLPAMTIQRQIRRARQKAVKEHDDKTIGTHSTDELFNHLLHQGFIQPDSLGDYVCPIPSLRRWCLARADMADPLAKDLDNKPEDTSTIEQKEFPSNSPRLGL